MATPTRSAPTTPGRRWLCLGAAFLLAATTGGCDSQDLQREFEEASTLPPAGYTETTDRGEVLSADADDWRVGPAFASNLTVDPAFPNPVSAQEVVIPVTVRFSGAIQGGLVLRAIDSTNRFQVLDQLFEASSPGAYVLRFNPIVLGRTGLVRLFIFDGTGALISYGDVLVE